MKSYEQKTHSATSGKLIKAEYVSYDFVCKVIVKTKLRGLSPHANYTDRAAKLVPTFADRGVSRGQRNGSPQPLISVF